MFVQELLGDLAESIPAGCARDLFQAPVEARFLAVREQFSGSLAAVPSLDQRQLGIRSQRDLLLLAIKSVGEPFRK